MHNIELRQALNSNPRTLGIRGWPIGTRNVCFGLGLLNSKMDETNAPIPCLNLKNNPFLCLISFNIFDCLYISLKKERLFL